MTPREDDDEIKDHIENIFFVAVLKHEALRDWP